MVPMRPIRNQCGTFSSPLLRPQPTSAAVKRNRPLSNRVSTDSGVGLANSSGSRQRDSESAATLQVEVA